METRDVVDTGKTTAPWNVFFKRFSFYAIAAQYFVVQFVITLFLYWLPTYLHEQYHVNFKEMGFIAGAPWLAMFVIIMLGGTISDKILSLGKSKFVARSIIAILGFIVFCISLFFALTTNNLYLCIIGFVFV